MEVVIVILIFVSMMFYGWYYEMKTRHSWEQFLRREVEEQRDEAVDDIVTLLDIASPPYSDADYEEWERIEEEYRGSGCDEWCDDDCDGWASNGDSDEDLP